MIFAKKTAKKILSPDLRLRVPVFADWLVSGFCLLTSGF
jgi:hypothetical protein